MMPQEDARTRRFRHSVRWQNAQMVCILMCRPRGVQGIMKGQDSLALVWQRNLAEMHALAVLAGASRRPS